MIPFLLWYILSTLIGWLAFPLLYRLLAPLADRGYGLARAAGLLSWGYLFWIGTSLGWSQNDAGGALLAILLLACLSLGIFIFSDGKGPAAPWPERLCRALGEVLAWAKLRVRLLALSEALFLLPFAFLALTRAANPDLVGTEKPMELAFINAILRAPSFPPPDPWLSGYAISYYYFGYVIAALLARLSGIGGSMAHNFMTALTFGLAAQASHALLFNLLSLRSNLPRHVLHRWALLAPLFLLLLSNWEGVLEVFHRAGLFWVDAPGAFNFWLWLDLPDLNQPPLQPLGWIPTRFWWWWRASRVVQDYTLQGARLEIIDEFPWFSFLLADLHPHVLNIPYTLLGIGVALGLYLNPQRRQNFPWISWPFFFFVALLLGGLAFLNTWDVLIIALLLTLAFFLSSLRAEGGHGGLHLERSLLLLLSWGMAAILLYLPFLLGFSSQARGILPNLLNPTRGAHLWIMFGPLFVPLLLYLWRTRPSFTASSSLWAFGWMGSLSLFLAFSLFSWGLALLIAFVFPVLAQQFLAAQGVTEPGMLVRAVLMRRLDHGFGALTLLFLLALSLMPLRKHHGDPSASEPGEDHAQGFFALLSTLGLLWILIPDFFYLGDQFGWRINTVFKFYYQAWVFLSLAAACAVAVGGLEKRFSRLSRGLMILALLAGLVYPVLSWWDRTGGFTSFRSLTLEDFHRLERFQPQEAAAIRFLQRAPFGVVAEAVGGSYTEYGRVATYTGLPDVLNWPGHEIQWRGDAAPQGTRQDDLRRLYETPSWQEAQRILEKYHVRYVYVGSLERIAYRVNLEKFERHLRPVFQQEGVIVYAVY
jgi:YYY domain-containing protein